MSRNEEHELAFRIYTRSPIRCTFLLNYKIIGYGKNIGQFRVVGRIKGVYG
jgi:hypothetical protein